MQRQYQITALSLYSIAAFVLIAMSIHASGGRLVYTMDDPYIHLAVAENILRGGYGVNLGEYSSPSSSIVFPFLMAIPVLLGIGDWGPLIVGTVCAGLSVWLMSGFIWRYLDAGNAHPLAWIWSIPGLILSISALALPMGGMEHPLHILGCVMVVAGVARMAETSSVSPLLIAGVFIAVLARFEGIAMALAAIAVMALGGYKRIALYVFGGVVALLASYSLFMLSLGLPVLPSSVLVKSNVSAAIAAGNATSVVQSLLSNLKVSLADRQGRMVFAAALCITVYLLSIRFGVFERRAGKKSQIKSKAKLKAMQRALETEQRPGRLGPMGVGAVALGVLVAHLFFGRYGWFGRYEVYTVAVLILALVYLIPKVLPASIGANTRWLTLSGVLAWVCVPYFTTTAATPGASRNIFEQQMQMHRFATGFFPKTVAVNDLGAVTYKNDNFVLDLYGLGSETARRQMHTSGWTADSVSRLTRSKGAIYAMIYDDWFRGAIPADWRRVAVLHTSHVSAAFGEVSFYLVDHAQESQMRNALDAFARTLPPGARLEVLSRAR